mmetsp:Transcript_57128/g.51405  ORF Transcript_57128/g.51405 Transcript_57128/m.51405 type:complete len:299 (-) Transcript_57128:312-1208(-)
MTTGQSVQAAPAPQQACKFDGRGRRKFKRACCCITILLLLNIFLLMHTAHSVGAIMWFMINGSMTYDDTTYVFVPGGAKTLCNDLCVDMCVVRSVGCDLPSCLNTCNQQLMDAGNPDDFQQLPTHPIVEDLMMVKPMPLDDDMVYYEDGMPLDGGIEQFYDDTELYFDDAEVMYPVDMIATEEPEQELVLVDTPQAPEYDDTTSTSTQAPDAQTKLDKMKQGIEIAAANIRLLKEKYVAQCGENPDLAGCNLSKATIKKLIDGLKKSIDGYNSFAVSVHIDIQVQVWMVDVEEVTAEP